MVRTGFETAICGFRVRRTNHSATLLPLKLIKFQFIEKSLHVLLIIVFSMHNITIIDCSTGLLVARLQQSIKQLTDENEEQSKALEEARTDVKELREFMKSVSISDTHLVKRYLICYNINPYYQLLTKRLGFGAI